MELVSPRQASIPIIVEQGYILLISYILFSRLSACIGLAKVPYMGIGKLFSLSNVPTRGPRQSPIHLSVPIQTIMVCGLIYFFKKDYIVRF